MTTPRPTVTNGGPPVPAPHEAGLPAGTVAAFMSGPLITVAPELPLWQARATMSAHGVHHLLVQDRGKIVAIVSDRDIAHRLTAPGTSRMPSRHEEAAMQRPVLQVAQYDIVTVPLTASLEEAAALILERDISALPVVNEAHEYIGIVTSRDLLRGLLACVLPPAPARDDLAPSPRVG